MTQVVGEYGIVIDETQHSVIKFSTPVKSVNIFREDVWAVDIHGGLNLILPKSRRDCIQSKLLKVFNFRHLERRNFKHPIKTVVTLSYVASILYCNNQCDIFFTNSTSPVTKYNVQQVGVMEGTVIYYLQTDGQLYYICEDSTHFITENIKTVFDATIGGFFCLTRSNFLIYHHEGGSDDLGMIDNVHQLALIDDNHGDVLLIIDNMRKQKGYDFRMVKEAECITPNMSIAKYEIDNVRDVCISSYYQQTYYLISAENELFFTGCNYPQHYIRQFQPIPTIPSKLNQILYKSKIV